MASVFKALGYSVSIVGVILLGIVAWESASERLWLFACLIAGMAASIMGMALRWISHRIGEKDKDRIEAKAESGSFSGRFPGASVDPQSPAGGSVSHVQGTAH